MPHPHHCEVCSAPCGTAVRDFAGPPGCWEPAVSEHWLCHEHMRCSRFDCDINAGTLKVHQDAMREDCTPY